MTTDTTLQRTLTREARLQAESRLVSGGLRTISRTRARRVLLGELTLEEALHN